MLGPIQVMNNLTDPELLGPSIATAFVATIYGVDAANFIFLPVAAKIRAIVEDAVHYREMVVDGLAPIDNRPIRTVVFPSNWELSAACAATVVVRLFEDNGVEPGRMASIGYGEHQPIADNDTDEGRARNRRVVVVVMAAVGGDE